MPGRIKVELALCLALTLATLAVFWPVGGHDFINYDDETYVSDNPHVLGGLTPDGLGWVWTADRAYNWHPLTWLSHMLDCELYGPDPGAHHRTSLILHVLNTLLLFLILSRATGAVWRGALVAALFAIHPLHVESVAWIAERKDVLSTFFFMLTLAFYIRYTSRETVARYLPVVVCLALGLMSKPMLVTLPFLLLLLDYWPLGRFGVRPVRRLVLEKLPLLALAVASGVATLVLQRPGLGSAEQFPLAGRIANAAIAYVTYAWKTVWPRDLAIFYPYPESISPWRATIAALLLVAATVPAWRARRERPWLMVGWLWFLGTLGPVIGIVQVGGQARADRYTYVPLIGLFIVAVWGVHALIRAPAGPGARSPDRLPALLFAGALIPIVVLAAAARAQVGTWRDSETVFRHALAVTDGNYLAHGNLALALVGRGRPDEVVRHLEASLEIKPDYYRAHHNLGVALSGLDRDVEAHRHLVQAVELAPGLAEGHYNLGISFVKLGEIDQALSSFARATEIDPTHEPAYFSWGTLLIREGRWDAAVTRLKRAVELDPSHGEAHYNLGVALYNRGSYADAWREVQRSAGLGFRPPERIVRLLKEKLAGSPGYQQE